MPAQNASVSKYYAVTGILDSRTSSFKGCAGEKVEGIESVGILLLFHFFFNLIH